MRHTLDVIKNELTQQFQIWIDADYQSMHVILFMIS